MRVIYLVSPDREKIALNERISKILDATVVKGTPYNRFAFIHSNTEDAAYVKESFLGIVGREFEDIIVDSSIADFYFLYATTMPEIVETIILIPEAEIFDAVYKLFAKKDKGYLPNFSPNQVVSFVPISKHNYDVGVL